MKCYAEKQCQVHRGKPFGSLLAHRCQYDLKPEKRSSRHPLFPTVSSAPVVGPEQIITHVIPFSVTVTFSTARLNLSAQPPYISTSPSSPPRRPFLGHVLLHSSAPRILLLPTFGIHPRRALTAL